MSALSFRPRRKRLFMERNPIISQSNQHDYTIYIWLCVCVCGAGFRGRRLTTTAVDPHAEKAALTGEKDERNPLSAFSVDVCSCCRSELIQERRTIFVFFPKASQVLDWLSHRLVLLSYPEKFECVRLGWRYDTSSSWNKEVNGSAQ